LTNVVFAVVTMSQFKVLKQSVGLISLNHPPVNGLSVDVRRAVLANIDLAMKENVKAIVLTGEGAMFSGGSDIKEIARGAYFKPPTLTELTNVLDSCKIPVISGKIFVYYSVFSSLRCLFCSALLAGMHGYALGGAMEIGLASHYRIATKATKIGFPEVSLGLLSGMLCPPFPATLSLDQL
jgi:3-hydroxyacyl-CoA dehydrogenase